MLEAGETLNQVVRDLTHEDQEEAEVTTTEILTEETEEAVVVKEVAVENMM